MKKLNKSHILLLHQQLITEFGGAGGIRGRPHPCPATSTVYECETGYSPQLYDFNVDGIVDSLDICIMVDYWGTDEWFCDIAPLPFGDGIVDVEDLITLSEHLFEDYRLIAHWALDEEEGNIAYDSVGGNNADLYGESIWLPTGGQVGGALDLDGIDDYINTPFVLDPSKGSFSVFASILAYAIYRSTTYKSELQSGITYDRICCAK